MKRNIKWTDKMKQILIDNFESMTYYQLADLLNLPYGRIYNKCRDLNLVRSDEYRANMERLRNENIMKSGEKSRFVKGMTAINKGIKMDAEKKEKLKHTFFQKGHKPHNTKYDGYERFCDGYVYIRVDGKFILKHRYIWEQTYGPIPENHVLRFLDNNPKNCTIENLSIMSRVDNMKINSIHNYPKEIISIIKLNKKLKKQINEKQDQRPPQSSI